MAIAYKDRTFCKEAPTCIHRKDCYRYLDDQQKAYASKLELDICWNYGKFDCYEQEKQEGRQPMNLTDYFDVTDITHIKAYRHLQDHGTWPRGFIPVECELDPTWAYQVAEKLASAFVKHKLLEIKGDNN